MAEASTDAIQAAALRLADAGVTWEHQDYRESAYAHTRFVDPRDPGRTVHRRGLLLTFTGAPDASEPNEDFDFEQVLLSPQAVADLLAALSGLVADPAKCKSLPLHRANPLTLFGATRLTLSAKEVRWNRGLGLFGDCTIPLSPALLADLGICLEAEAAMLALVGDPEE